ncbi:type II toxin-antitoxin system RelE/ParE family toxin [uncultured Polaribacter sp.]|uniref:type II toxin-antitoxin system RelE/ParE family toxin n=1 Tax=uncultured Polaribacter sp. TaxID=174711 RepID=UPI0026278D06|nr:type II toxin-antitoxin system RelE/ParE family toxin [uncultured Polaribacter sp.]
MKIVWSVNANLENLDNIEYLLDKWSLKVCLNYEEKIMRTEKLLLANPKLGIFDKELLIYKILVVPQIYMLYDISDETIQVVSIWNNYQKPYL